MFEAFKEMLFFQTGRPELFVVGIMMWIMLLVAGYFILYPLIWERKYFNHEVTGIVTDKRFYTTTNFHSYNNGKTTTYYTTTTNHYKVILNLVDDLDFTPLSTCVDFGQEVFDSVQKDQKVTLSIKEKHRRFRFGTEATFKYYGYDIDKIKY